MAEVGKISVRVSPDTSNFRRALKRQLESITKGLEAKVNIDPDLDGFRQKINASTKGLDHAKVNVDIDDKRFGSLFRQRIKKIGAIKVPVEPDVKSFRFAIAQRFKSIEQSIGNVGASALNAVGNVRAFGIGIAGLVAIASLAVPAIGILSGAIAALPGLLVAVIAPIGAIALGLDGIAKAAGNSGLPKAFKSLQEGVSSVFEKGLLPTFTRLVDLFPSLQTGLSAVADGVVSMGNGFVDALTSGRGMAQIQGTLFNIADALKASAPGIQDFTAGMLTLVNSFSTKLPGMAAAFNDWAKSVVGWVDRITTVDASGTSAFDRAMQGLGETFKGLGTVIGDLFTKGFDWISNPANIQKVSAFFIELKNAVDLLWPVLDKAFTALMQFIDGANNLLAFFSGEWSKLTPGTPLDTIANGILVAQAAITGAFDVIRNAAATTWAAIPAGAQAAWNVVVQSATSAIAGVVGAIVSAGAQVMAEVGSWPGKIQSFFADAGSWLVAAGQQIVQGLINGISGMITTAVAKAKELAGAVKNAVTGFLGIHSPSTVMADIGGFIGDGLINGLKSKQAQIEATAKGIGQSIQDAFDWSGYAQRGLDAGFAFAGANADQFMSDLGIGGKGLLSQLGEQGLKFGTDFASKALSGDTFNFQVANVDDAMAIKNNQINKRALGVVGKSK